MTTPVSLREQIRELVTRGVQRKLIVLEDGWRLTVTSWGSQEGSDLAVLLETGIGQEAALRALGVEMRTVGLPQPRRL
jgi:hypothetical protein